MVATAVLKMARDKDIDVIAVATHGRSGLKRLLLRSVADKIVRGAFTPVLVYRPTPNLTPQWPQDNAGQTKGR